MIHPRVFALHDITCPFDFLILARFYTRRQLDNFIKKLQTYDFVERTGTKLISKTIKDEHT